MTARIDRSEYSTVVWCTLCPSFAELVEQDRAHAVRISHNDRHHKVNAYIKVADRVPSGK